MGANDQLASGFLILIIDLMRYTESVRQDALFTLRGLEEDLTQQINESDIYSTIRIASRQRRIEALLTQVRATIATAYTTAAVASAKQYLDIAKTASLGSLKLVENIFENEIQTVATSPARLRAIVSDVIIQGAPLKDWWAKLASDTTHRVVTQLRMGLLAGETNEELVKRLRGRATGRLLTVQVDGQAEQIREFAGGTLTLSQRDASTLVRTATNAVANQTFKYVAQDNADIIRGLQVLVTLDNKTTLTCIALSGGAWDLEGNPLPESRVDVPFPGDPPYHMNCRTYLIFLLKSWESILEDKPDAPQDLSKQTQSSMDGQVAASINYEDWLKTQPESRQLEILGKARFSLWSKGTLNLADLVDTGGNPLTISQLQARYDLP